MATGTGWPFGGPWVSEADAAHGLLFQRWQMARASSSTTVRLSRRRSFGRSAIRSMKCVSRPAARRRPDHAGQPLLRPGTRHPGHRPCRTGRSESQPPGAGSRAGALSERRAVAGGGGAQIRAGGERCSISQSRDRRSPARLDRARRASGRSTRCFSARTASSSSARRLAARATSSIISRAMPIRHYLARSIAPSAAVRRRACVPSSTTRTKSTMRGAGGCDAVDLRGVSRSGVATISASTCRRCRATVPPRPRPRLADYRETMSDLLLETFTIQWQAWAGRYGAIMRNQAHGSPANMLDLYAASDIPETEGLEIDRSKWAALGRARGRPPPDRRRGRDVAWRTLPLDARGCSRPCRPPTSSRASITSSITAPLRRRRARRGQGGCSTPPSSSTIAIRGGAICRRSISTSRGSSRSCSPVSPDHDVLLYYPFYDFIANPGTSRLAHFGGANAPDEGTAFEAARDLMQRRGYTYDFVSDRQLQRGPRRQGTRSRPAAAPATRPSSIPASRYLSLETLSRVVALATDGASVIALGGSRPMSRAWRIWRIDAIACGARCGHSVRRHRRGRHCGSRRRSRPHPSWRQSRDVADAGEVSRESLVDRGLEFARRRSEQGRFYFLSNTSAVDVDGWIPFDPSAPHCSSTIRCAARCGPR